MDIKVSSEVSDSDGSQIKRFEIFDNSDRDISKILTYEYNLQNKAKLMIFQKALDTNGHQILPKRFFSSKDYGFEVSLADSAKQAKSLKQK